MSSLGDKLIERAQGLGIDPDHLGDIPRIFTEHERQIRRVGERALRGAVARTLLGCIDDGAEQLARDAADATTDDIMAGLRRTTSEIKSSTEQHLADKRWFKDLLKELAKAGIDVALALLSV